jgi:hypothetical protein
MLYLTRHRGFLPAVVLAAIFIAWGDASPVVRAQDAGKPAVRFRRHEIDSFPAGYQVAVADVNGDGKPDVIALSTNANRVDWYENPGWKRRPVAATAANIDLAPRDLDGDGRPELALASGFYYSDSTRGGEIQLLRQAADLDSPWTARPIAVDPVVHRVRWGDLDGDGRPELVHGPLFARGSKGADAPVPAHLWAFRVPSQPDGVWEPWKIDETLTVIHGLHVADLDRDGRDEILTASFEGIHRFDFEGKGPDGQWRKVRIAAGGPPVGEKPGSPRGSSEVVPGNLGPDRPFLAAIEPWHGHQVVVYTPEGEGPWRRTVLDETLREGHALLVADFDADGNDEIVAGWRGGDGGLALYDPTADAAGLRFAKTELDRGLNVEGAAATDINRDGRLDIVALAGRSNKLVWYENRGF